MGMTIIMVMVVDVIVVVMLGPGAHQSFSSQCS